MTFSGGRRRGRRKGRRVTRGRERVRRACVREGEEGGERWRGGG